MNQIRNVARTLVVKRQRPGVKANRVLGSVAPSSHPSIFFPVFQGLWESTTGVPVPSHDGGKEATPGSHFSDQFNKGLQKRVAPS